MRVLQRIIGIVFFATIFLAGQMASAQVSTHIEKGKKGIYTVNRKYIGGIGIGDLNDSIWSLMNLYLKSPVNISGIPSASDVLDLYTTKQIIVYFEAELIWDPEDGEKPFDDRNKEPYWGTRIDGYLSWDYLWLFPEKKIKYSKNTLRRMDDKDYPDYNSYYKAITTSDSPGGGYVYRVVKAGFKVDVRNNRFYSITGIIRNY